MINILLKINIHNLLLLCHYYKVNTINQLLTKLNNKGNIEGIIEKINSIVNNFNQQMVIYHKEETEYIKYKNDNPLRYYSDNNNIKMLQDNKNQFYLDMDRDGLTFNNLLYKNENLRQLISLVDQQLVPDIYYTMNQSHIAKVVEIFYDKLQQNFSNLDLLPTSLGNTKYILLDNKTIISGYLQGINPHNQQIFMYMKYQITFNFNNKYILECYIIPSNIV